MTKQKLLAMTENKEMTKNKDTDNDSKFSSLFYHCKYFFFEFFLKTKNHKLNIIQIFLYLVFIYDKIKVNKI
jgi:hypothetical protein